MGQVSPATEDNWVTFMNQLWLQCIISNSTHVCKSFNCPGFSPNHHWHL